MTALEFVIEVLGGHSREGFSCGVEPLDRYFREQVSQDVRRRATLCYVAVGPGGEIAGYYTLAAAGVALSDLPLSWAKKLPRYPSVPVARLGRLAVSRSFQGHQLGAALLWDAIERSARAEMAVYAVVVDAKDETAAAFYRHHGFASLATNPLQLVLPLAGVRRTL